MPTTPLPDDEPLRLARLQALGVLDTGPEPGFDALVAATAQLTGCPVAALCLIDADRQWIKAAVGMPRDALPRWRSFCTHTILGDGPLEVPDAATDPRFADHPAVAEAPRLRLYAGVPLRVDDANVGTLFVMRAAPGPLDAAALAALERMATVAAALLHGRPRLHALEHERLRLLDFARASGDWMWETDEALRYTWVSGAFEAVTGHAPADVLGRCIADGPLLDPLGEPLSDGPTLHQLLHTRQHITRVLTAKPTARGVLPISRSAVPTFDGQGRFRGYRGTARDMSARVASERDAHAQAELLRKLSSQVPGVIFQFRLLPDGTVHYLYASDACRTVYGAEPPRDGDGGEPEVVCQAVHPDDRAAARDGLRAAARSLAPWRTEFPTLRDGRVRWLALRAQPEPHPDGGQLWHGFVDDVTERKEIELALRTSETRWRLAAEAAGIGIVQFDLAGGRVALDAIAGDQHGLPASRRELPMAAWLGGLHPADREAVRQALQQAFDRHGRLDMRFRLAAGDGRARTLEVAAHCTLDREGRPAGLLGTCRDVTQQAVHEQLRRDKETAERASRAKSEFLSRVSHELRTPLNGILGFAQLMALDTAHPLHPDQALRLDSVQHAGRHLLELINDVLDLARIEQGDAAMQCAPVDLDAAVRACIAMVQPLADRADVRIVAPPAAPDAHWSLADARAVEQVLINLLSNAIKYNRAGGRVEVALWRSPGTVGLSVRDEGQGLTPDQQAHLFEPFNRLGAEQRRVEGTGLGLVIARALAQTMGGQLRLASAPGTGSTFTLTLPATDAPADRRSAARPVEAPPTGPEAPRTTRSVLYIEDEPLNQLLMREVFRTQPLWTLHVASDGATGLAHLADARPDLVLIDMNLPDTHGLDLIRRIRTHPARSDLHCIALSADAMQAQVDAALAAGYNAYWTKPIHVPDVLAGLARVLG